MVLFQKVSARGDFGKLEPGVSGVGHFDFLGWTRVAYKLGTKVQRDREYVERGRAGARTRWLAALDKS